METRYFVTAVIVVVVAVTLTWLIFIPHPDKYGVFDNVAGVGAVTMPGSGEESYTSRELGFSTRAPYGFIASEAYSYSALGGSLRVPGVAFLVPKSLYEGTNLSPDSYISVETIGGVDCRPSSFILTSDPGRRVTLGGTSYLYAESRTAGAGNFYDEAVYVTGSGSRCFAIRRFAHFTNLANYPVGTVREFDRAALVVATEEVARNLVIR